jgi:hypothetical protein
MAHPLLDRRDLTRARDAQGTPAAPAPLDAGLAAEICETNRLLRSLLSQESSDIAELCVSDREPPENRAENFPTRGVTRLIVRRTGNGGLYTLVAAGQAQLLQPNENRLGGRIVNTGANPAVLFLAADLLQPGSAAPLGEGAAQIGLSAGQAWDLKLGDLLWCGTVIAVSTLGTTLTAAEV